MSTRGPMKGTVLTHQVQGERRELERRLLPRLAGYFGERGGTTPALVLTQVREAAYSRLYVFRLSSPDGVTAARGLAVKVFTGQAASPEIAKEQFTILRAVWPAFAESLHFGIPRPLDLLADIPALVMEEVSGRPAPELFTPALWLPGRASAALDVCRRSGAWLRHFHAVTRVSSGPLDVEAKLASVPHTLARLEQYGFSRRLGDTVKAGLSSVGEMLLEWPLESACVHGDFTVNNVLLDRHRVVVLDVGGRYRNVIYHDLASFLNSIRLVALSRPVPRAATSACEEAFLEGYFGEACPDAAPLWFLRVFGLASVALEILGRRGRRAIPRVWVRVFVTRLLGSLLKEAPAR